MECFQGSYCFLVNCVPCRKRVQRYSKFLNYKTFSEVFFEEFSTFFVIQLNISILTHEKIFNIYRTKMLSSCCAVSPSLNLPLRATEIEPVSSETIMAIASVSCETPSAALWRRPSFLGILSSCETGRMHEAAISRLFCTISAPSCSGEFFKKIF